MVNESAKKLFAKVQARCYFESSGELQSEGYTLSGKLLAAESGEEVATLLTEAGATEYGKECGRAYELITDEDVEAVYQDAQAYDLDEPAGNLRHEPSQYQLQYLADALWYVIYEMNVNDAWYGEFGAYDKR